MAMGFYDLIPNRHSILRNLFLLGHIGGSFFEASARNHGSTVLNRDQDEEPLQPR